MSVHAKQPGDEGDLQFVIRDPEKIYSMREVVDLLQKAQDMGLPLEKESWLEQITIRQLDALVNNKSTGDT